MPAITKSGNVLTKKPTKIEKINSVSVEYIVNPTYLLDKIKRVDGKGSGLDADLVRGDYINPRMFKNRIINGDFSIWQRGEDFLFGTPDSWAASTSYSVGDIVIPTTANGFYYECTVAGTSGSSEPTWPTSVGGTVTDGDVTWECKGVQYNGGGYTADRYYSMIGNTDGYFISKRSIMNNLNSLRVEAINPPTNLSDTSINRFWTPFEQRFEGNYLFDLIQKKSKVTISFLFKSNVSGKFSVLLRNNTNTDKSRSWGIDTWATSFNYPGDESVVRYTFTIPLDNTWNGGIFNDENLGFNIIIAGISNANMVASEENSWISGDYICAPDSVDWTATVGNYIEIAQLQLEEGEVATDFEHVPYDIQLMRCMRYYEEGCGLLKLADGPQYTAGNYLGEWISFKVPKRIVPSVTESILHFAQRSDGTWEDAGVEYICCDGYATYVVTHSNTISWLIKSVVYKADAEL